LVSVKSIKNRCVFFDSRIRHGSILNYGNDINDGRLTINGFIE
jgi:Rps23 Pro-64 3,4-dihydroxylase Tpa1-like proline 4-hydroxylase